MQEFKFLSDNKDDGIIGAYNETDLVSRLTDRNNGRVFTVPFSMMYSMRCRACRLHMLLPDTVDNDIEYEGLFSYQITGVQEIEDRRIRYWATIWFQTHTGRIPYHITETIRP
jgi:hypothetical protein